jgi:hypothetical protein
VNQVYQQNGYRATADGLEDLSRQALRSFVWADRDKKRNAYDPRLLRKFGTNAGLLLGHLVFWSGKGHDPDGWIYKRIDDLIHEVGLDSRHAVDKARAVLREEHVIEEDKRSRKKWVKREDAEGRVKREYVVAHPSPVLHFRVRWLVLIERLGVKVDTDTLLELSDDDDFEEII